MPSAPESRARDLRKGIDVYRVAIASIYAILFALRAAIPRNPTTPCNPTPPVDRSGQAIAGWGVSHERITSTR